MATTANPPPGATPTIRTTSDPFTGSSNGNSGAMRFAPFDTDQFSLYSTSSPSQAKRALEAHLKDTDRRIQDASHLGTTLVQQRKDLAARLKDVEQVHQDNEVPADLRRKLAELEKEYNEVGKESARAFLPKARLSTGPGDPNATPSAFTGSGRESPTKITAPSRRQRNQPSNRVHDIEFATEISTSLLAQVRQLQTALAEKDEELKETTSYRAQLEAEAAGMVQRIKQMDDSEQKFKDENWNLEMRLQELEANFKESSDKEQRLTQTLKSTQAEKAAAQRDLDDLKVEHGKLNEEHAVIKRQQETDLHGLRRDAAGHETEKGKLQKKIEDLTAQNTELARAVSYRWNQPSAGTDTDFVSADEEQLSDGGTPENSEPASPVKGTPRHGMLESETLKSSLNHAHRMIQNLKNNIHREKTEKIELKRMLQDARDELEARRSDGNGNASLAKKRRSDQDGSIKFRKPARPLGANRSSTTEILEDEPDWEDHDGASTPSKSRNVSSILGADEAESTDAAFETATEKEGTSTDAFETATEREAVDDDDSDELTETESGANRGGTIRKVSSLIGANAGNRRSFQSTASTSAGEEDDDEEVQTPVQAPHPAKYRLRMNNNRGSKRGGRVSDLIAGESPASQYSPASSTGTPQRAGGQSLGDELDALDEGSNQGTPASQRLADTPETQRMVSVEPESASRDFGAPAQARPEYADAGVMAEPWEPEVGAKEKGLRERAGEVVGGAFVGFELGRLTGKKDEGAEEQADAGAHDIELQQSEIVSQETAPVVPPPLRPEIVNSPSGLQRITDAVAEPAIPLTTAAPLAVQAEAKRRPENLDFSAVQAQDFEPEDMQGEPQTPITPILPKRSSRRLDAMYSSDGTLTEDRDFANASDIPGTDGARVGAGFFSSQQKSGAQEDGAGDDVSEPKVLVPQGGRAPLGEITPNAALQRDKNAERESMIPITKPLQVRKPVADEGSQTLVSGDDIENMMKAKSGVSTSEIAAGALAGAAAGAAITEASQSPSRPTTAINPNAPRRSIDGAISNEAAPMRTPKRPASAGSMRNKVAAVPPPLPEDHTQKIAAAQKAPGTPSAASAGAMGPPLMPASAYKQNRPRTPAEAGRTLSRDGTTPRAPSRMSGSQPMSPSVTSRRTSVSSFASELDERFNIQRGQLIYPEGVQPATDPRMIQAITQTMIGEYLWKYTRKAGRSETSTSRHRRFFWVHPYTRTLYWSEKDPSTAGRDMLKAKSVAIEAVRVITDDNTYPPGLHRKSIVIVTPGREIVFTAPTSQRHETWFNALSYLLLRTEQEKEEAEDAITKEDIDEFNPGIGNSIRRSISRMTGRSQSRISLSSYNSRTTRTSSPQRASAQGTATLAQRQSAAALRTSTVTTTPAPVAGTASLRYSTIRDSGAGGRLSSITSKFRTSTAAPRGSMSASTRGRPSTMSSTRGRASTPGAGSDIYNASVAADSAEELRAVIERQEQDADRLENVRACCDGKHDVGSLSRRGRHSSFGSRFSVGHAHSHAHPRVDPARDSQKPRP